ncbi:MAG: lipid A biosynthesis acyltransferase [Myxococcales bacterium]|jgi:KDO2-lipid IV(A) lauroyltransferase|nr:lipid A biosynthesis acyltransferase [Myxococcales bacterium]
METKRVPLLKRSRRFLRYCLLRSLYAAASSLPLPVARVLGRALARLGLLIPGLRRKTLAGIATAYPEMSAAERLQLARATFAHFGNFLGEVCCIDAITRELDRHVEMPDEDRARYLAAIAEGRGVLMATGHVGNFELMARRIGLLGPPSSAVAKVSSDPHMTAFIDKLRSKGGYHVIWRGKDKAQGSAFDGIRQALAEGHAVGLLIDQDTKGRGLFVDFFGKRAFTPRGIADLALLTGCPVITGFIHRKPDGGHRVSIERIPVERTGDDERDAQVLLQTLTTCVERAIRLDPGAWPWFHERWRHRPPDEALSKDEPSKRALA